MSSQAKKKPDPEGDDQQTQAVQETYSARFVAEVERQWNSQMSDGLEWTSYEKALAQHTFLKVDEALRDADQRRLDQKNADKVTPYIWNNINVQKLALNTVHVVGLGLDPILPNHVHAVFYWNRRDGKYDCALQRGYAGKDLCARTMTLDPQPIDIVYHLVHERDKFVPVWRSDDQPGDRYIFETPEPFNRGQVIGGFGYVVYDDPRKNRLYLVPPEEFKLAEKVSKTDKFWKGDSRERMQYKTVVNRVADKLPIDPRKVNARSYAYVTGQEHETVDDEMTAEMAGAANEGPIIDIVPEPPKPKDQGEADEAAGDAAQPSAAAAEEGPDF